MQIKTTTKKETSRKIENNCVCDSNINFSHILTFLGDVTAGRRRAHLCRNCSSIPGCRRHSSAEVDQTTPGHWIFATRRHLPSTDATLNGQCWCSNFCRRPIQVGALLLCERVIVRIIKHALIGMLLLFLRWLSRHRFEFFGSRSSTGARFFTRWVTAGHMRLLGTEASVWAGLLIIWLRFTALIFFGLCICESGVIKSFISPAFILKKKKKEKKEREQQKINSTMQ